jgi:glycosyltransferase involved in cell wall biosynthesis
MTPRVSIVCPTFNGASRGYLGETIESVLDQTLQGYELIIVDDGSTDRTKEICEPYLEDSRVHYIFQENGGPAKARNTGIEASSGEFICFLDDDDLWKPNKLQRQIQFIDNQLNDFGNWGMVFTWAELIDAHGNIIGYRGHRQEGAIYKYLLFENIIDATSSVLVKRGVLEDIGPFDESLIPSCEDWDLWLRISKKYLVFPVKDYLVRYREHQNGISANLDKLFSSAKQVVDKVLTETPEDVSPKAAYASLYLNRSVVFFAAEEYDRFRKFFMRGALLSLRAVRVEHLLLLVLSFSGFKTVRLLKTLKRGVQKLLIRWQRSVAQPRSGTEDNGKGTQPWRGV